MNSPIPGSPPEPVIELVDLFVSYGDFQALRGITLRMPPGAVGLVGRNGAGKSTLLRVLLGLVAPTSGHGRVLGVSIAGAGRSLRRSVGYMPENDAFVLGMWGIEQVALAGELCGLTRRQAIRRAHEVLGYVDLGEARYRAVENYSTGMRQRLKLAVALVHDPRLLLLDEPTVGLDPTSRERMLELVADLIRKHEKSLVISTHLLGDIEHVCDHVVMLEGGRVIADGPLAQIVQSGSVQYRLRWDGDGAAFLEGLARTGGRVLDEDRGSRGNGAAREVRLAMPTDFEPRQFFHLAQEKGITLLTMQTDHGDLTEIYHRLLEREPDRA